MAVSRILPRWAPMAAITIGQRIFAKRSADETVLAHEGVHVEQQRRDGWSFYWRYIVSPRRRMEYEAEAYAVNYVPLEKSEQRLNLLLRLMKRKDVGALVNACDAGREGELIFRSIVQHARVKKPIER